MPGLPQGTVTFLFTDVEASTELVRQLGERYPDVREEYRKLVRAAIQERGQEVDAPGDACFIAFSRAKDALSAAIAAQRAILKHAWPAGAFVRVRMGLHTGEPLTVSTEYAGLDVHRAARISAAGHGGQILLSEATRALVELDLPEGIGLRDLGPHQLKGLGRPEHIFQVVGADLPAAFPPLRSLDLLRSNLPLTLTSFVGREREIAEVKRLLSNAAVLTLTGAGGVGKTRLALRVAEDLVATYPDGVWLVELAVLTDPALIPQVVASTLGVREQPDRPITETLVDNLRPKKLLLLLDNCEHLLRASAELTESLLRNCSGLRILATSREPMNIAGEVVWPVPSLTLPDIKQPPSVESLRQREAARLFAERAVSHRPTFALSSENARAVAQICRRLDGIPLAIELAAARVGVLSEDQIEERLTDRFKLLTGGRRTALPRHQTLRATLDWSYDLLTEKERIFFCQLGVFAGGWTLEAAEAICTREGVVKADVLDLSTHLVDKSLVLVDTHGRQARYRMLETVREYGRNKLLESGEAHAVRARHLHWCRQLGEAAEPELVGVGQAAWFDRLELEHDNIRVALEWALESGEIEAGLRLAVAVAPFWFVRGYLAEGRRWLEALLERRGAVAPAVRAKALKAAGRLAGFGQSDYAYGRAVYQESLAIWRELEDKQGIATALAELGILAFGQADLTAARGLYEESLALRRQMGDRPGVAATLHNLGRVAYREGNWETAQALYEESLAICRELGDPQNIAVALTNLGFLAFGRGDYPSARARFEEGLAIQQELGDKRRMAYSLEGFAFLAAMRGAPEQAARLLGAAEALRETIGAPLPPVDRPDYDRIVALVRGGLLGDVLKRAWAEGRRMTSEVAVLEAKQVR